MVIKPIAHNAQRQSITTALRNICRDYPAGGTVLRELLQNADDAGATEVRFILDERTHPVGKLIDPKLAEYQGPALLAFNNSKFTENDFVSLAHIGDSLKLQDGETTGKFGRGFNSVYNWTDSPSIVSGNRLLILDPHDHWSTGGPMFDFVEDHGELEMQNHMAAYESIMERFDQPFEGTIIRIPLRTSPQALESKISNRATTVSEIADVLQKFAPEFGDCGLLFMRNVQKLEFGSTSTPISSAIEMHGELLQSHKLKVNQAVKKAIKTPTLSFDLSFEAQIRYRSEGVVRNTAFVIHHSIQCGSMSNSMRDWSKEQQQLPWVAVAAKLPIESAEGLNGSLFTVLPLPISSDQPVHIHGLFSLSPDRARLHHLGDRSTQDEDPARWNAWLLQDLVPNAWTKALSRLAQLYPNQPAFERWPKDLNGIQSPLNNALTRVIESIEKNALELWPTDSGYLASTESLLYTGVDDPDLREALREAGAPIVYVPQTLQQEAEKVFKERILQAQHLCHFLAGKQTEVTSWSNRTKHKLLEYVLSEPGFTDYDGIELFPFMDGIHRSIGNLVVFVHRDSFEEGLFNLDNSRNLDLKQLSGATQLVLKQGCERSNIHPSIRYRSASSLADYCKRKIYQKIPEEVDMTILDEETVAFVSKTWTWLSLHGIDVQSDEIFCLWLIPLSNGMYRKAKPLNSNSQIYFAPMGELGDLMWTLDAKSTTKPLPLIDTHLLPGQSSSNLLENSKLVPSLCIKDGASVVSFLEWLQGTTPLLDHVPDKQRHLIAKLVASKLSEPLSFEDRGTVIGILTDLKIFQKLSWVLQKGAMKHVLTWSNLSSCTTTIGLLDDFQPVPEIEDVQFVLANHSSSARQLLQTLGLGDCLTSVQTIQDHIIPAWQDQRSRDWSSSSKEQMAAFILGNFSRLPPSGQKKLQTLQIVPVARFNGKDTSNFSRASQLIDPSVHELKELCFDGEEIVPKKSFLILYFYALKGCGLKTRVDETVVQHRIRCYSSGNYLPMDVRSRALNLLRSTCQWTSPLEDLNDSSELRRLEWIPTIGINGTTQSLKSSRECRSHRDRSLVGSQLPILDIQIPLEWQKRLGWENILPKNIILSQLQWGIQKEEHRVVDKVLAYISDNGLTDSLSDDLNTLPFVLASNGLFIVPSKAFSPSPGSSSGYSGLNPYLANVDRNFWREHQRLLASVGVQEYLQLEELLNLQALLEAKSPLEDKDSKVAIEILNIACHFPRAELTDLKVIDESGMFHPIHRVNFNDLGPLKAKEKVNLSHPDIPLKTIEKLGIDSLRERLIKGMLEIEDVDDDDEFDQRENVTTRIADTLDRYPVETTFREYLANADDIKEDGAVPGATKISWLLDPRTHAGDNLLTPEMRQFQGPAFLAYNDGVFSDEDFKGFKNVGEGSKSRDKETIGQFGRGSQTMYHWTDVPMILSGKYLVILDPQQLVLPKNQIKGKRKPGIKLELSKLRHACSDQLAPFEGLWDYESKLDYYPGTIFRFPLRGAKTTSLLRTSKTDLHTAEVRRLMDAYFDEARISLLFLRRIKSIDFHVQGQPDSGWSVTRRAPLDEDAKSFSELVICSFVKNKERAAQIAGKDKWWVAIEDLNPPDDILPETSRRVMKNVECGLAALISSQANEANLQVPQATQSRVFHTLPLPLSSDLPVHVHGTFALSGDRQSISTDEHGARSHGAKWNRYLLQDELPKLYLTFLEDLGKMVLQDVFKFWPQGDPPKRSCAEILCVSFWEQLPTSSNRLFPKAQSAQTDTKVGQRRAAKLFDINQAVFDFLPKTHSPILASLLLSLGVNLVREIPADIAKRLKVIADTYDLNFVTGSLLRKLFKTERSRTYLLEEMAKSSRVWEVLFNHLAPAEADFADLDGCYILPLAHKTLASLNFLGDNEAKLSSYYLVSEKELTLFGFASKCFVSGNINDKLVQILQSGKFNVAPLKLSHVERLLQVRPAVSSPHPDANKWLVEFWKFWNGRIEDSPNIDGFDFGIYQAKRNGSSVDMYATPSEFLQFPSVVEPSDGEQKELCDIIPGLYRFDPKSMPKTLADNEKSFYKEESFHRLMAALVKLAGNSALGTFVQTHFDDRRLETLRKLVIHHVPGSLLSTDPGKATSRIASLRSLPLWPSFQWPASGQLVSATDSLLATNNGLLVPWMKDSHRFVDNAQNQACLVKLGCTKLSTETLLGSYVLPVPSIIDDDHFRHLNQLMGAISGIVHSTAQTSQTTATLMRSTIAVDGNQTLKVPSKLYDDQDMLFTAAFKLQKGDKFLHEKLRGHRSFWLKVGLRQRANSSILLAADYFDCLNAMKLRLNVVDGPSDPDLSVDIREVLLPLTSPTSSTPSFTVPEWSVVAQEKVFRSITHFISQPEYRAGKMNLVAREKPLMSLTDVIFIEHAAICWSQTPFPLQQPRLEVMTRVSRNGQPTTEMVWRHLLYLKDIAPRLRPNQLSDFLADLCKTYEHLQDRLPSSAGFSLEDNAVWLNLDSMDPRTIIMQDMQLSWYATDELILATSCDSGSVKAVKPGLMQYDKLLKAMGCSSIIWATVSRPELKVGPSLVSSLRDLWKKDKLVDIQYSSEGRTISAHRNVLAAMSSMCAGQFTSGLLVENVIAFDKIADGDAFLSYHTLSTMIKYAYGDDIDWEKMQVKENDNEADKARKLNLLLDLHKGADYWIVDSLKSLVEDKLLVSGKVFINLENVTQVRKRAGEARALEFENMCATFINQNRASVDKARGVKVE
ncbi:Sacsin [Lachnellula suecica]|uniref:Sacsin n=1 Tax=Lachnellula suecica TaxID=602035 RepID=A0A8T9BXR6_9HELO|nr:Sacsin [Lachnellula suecica]